MKISSLALLCIIGCLILTGCQSTPPPQYAIGPSYFPDGDSLVLEDVQSTLGTFGTNDVVTIEGKYKLVDKTEAKLLLTITQTEGDAHSSVAPEQMTTIKDENGHFKLSIDIQHNGYLHLSLRSASGEDKSYGSLYLGTEEQMNKIANWDLSKW